MWKAESYVQMFQLVKCLPVLSILYNWALGDNIIVYISIYQCRLLLYYSVFIMNIFSVEYFSFISDILYFAASISCPYLHFLDSCLYHYKLAIICANKQKLHRLHILDIAMCK